MPQDWTKSCWPERCSSASVGSAAAVIWVEDAIAAKSRQIHAGRMAKPPSRIGPDDHNGPQLPLAIGSPANACRNDASPCSVSETQRETLRRAKEFIRHVAHADADPDTAIADVVEYRSLLRRAGLGS